jgi:hypothetical protein
MKHFPNVVLPLIENPDSELLGIVGNEQNNRNEANLHLLLTKMKLFVCPRNNKQWFYWNRKK